MKLFIRAHDLGVRGEQAVADRLVELGLDGVQLVAYKVLDDVPYAPGAISVPRAERIRDTLASAGKTNVMTGAYFNPVHPDRAKAERGAEIFRDYLRVSRALGCDAVGSETGSFNGDKWTYHPENRTDHALDTVVEIFRSLADTAAGYGVNIAMEGAFGHVCWDVDRLALAVERVGRPNVQVVFDLYNYLDISNFSMRYDILRYGLSVFGKKIRLFHVKDCFLTGDGRLQQCGVGRGILDFARIVNEIGRFDPDASLVLEGTVGADVAPAVAHLRKYM